MLEAFSLVRVALNKVDCILETAGLCYLSGIGEEMAQIDVVHWLILKASAFAVGIAQEYVLSFGVLRYEEILWLFNVRICACLL